MHMEYLVSSTEYPLTRHFYEGGRWYNNKYDGYVSSKNYFAAIGFTTPESSGDPFTLFTLKINFNMPFIRDQGSESTRKAEGTFYFKLYEAELPKSGFPSADDKDVTANWVCKDKNGKADTEVHTLATPVELTAKNIKASTKYYLVFSSSSIIQVGYEDVDPRWRAELTAFYTNGDSPSIYIKDNGDNTVKISGYLGKAGTNNARVAATIYYTIGTNLPYTAIDNIWSPSSSAIRIDLDESKTYYSSENITITSVAPVNAYIVCKFEHNTTRSGLVSLRPKFYVAPRDPGYPELSDNSFKNNRLTIKQNWTYEWQLAKPHNSFDYNAVKGYRIRVMKRATEEAPPVAITGLELDPKDNLKLKKGVGTAQYIDRESTTTTVTFDPKDLGFKPGNLVSCGIYAYSRNGLGEQLFSGKGTSENMVTSQETLVQNAGVVNVKTADGWKEGQVWVKLADGWKEAETVNVKTADGWKESQ